MTAVLVALVLAAIPFQLADVPDSDREAVRQASFDYVAGFLSADPERIERGVHPSLQKVVVQSMQGGRETLAFMDRHTLSEFARMSEGQPEAERLVDVTVLEILRNTAVVRIDSSDFVDHAQIANINGAWRIINVLWAPKDGQSLPEVGSEDRTAIEQAGFDYVDGYYAGSAERLGKTLHPRLQKVTVRSLPNGREIFGYASADGLADYARTGQSRKAEDERAVDVELLYAEGNIATIRIDSVDFVDFAHVARINGEWVIVNVLWFPRG